jgi:hypothetical protein
MGFESAKKQKTRMGLEGGEDFLGDAFSAGKTAMSAAGSDTLPLSKSNTRFR